MTLLKSIGRAREFVSPALPALNPLLSRVERILTRWPDVVANPPEKDRERLVQMVKERYESDNWEHTKLSLVTSAARALFDPDRRMREDLAELRTFYYRETEASTRPGFLAAMFSIYMETFDAQSDHTRQLADALKVSAGHLGARWRKMLDAVPELLSPEQAPRAVASKMIAMEDPWSGLQRLGFRNPHAPGLMNEAHLAFVELLEPHLDKRLQMERLINWLKPKGKQAKASGAGEAISALLGHWRDRTPSSEVVSYLTESIIGMYGDPRVQRGGVWAAVPGDRMDVLLRWLTGENIRFFMDVVSAVEDSYMWEPRRRFWLRLYDQGRIDGAWVAFSEAGAREARKRGGGKGTLNYGVQVVGGSRSNTSLLILKIGRKIVVEGSHNYKIHIFDETNRLAPKLYQARYDCDQIRLIPGALAKPHLGYWEGWVLEHI